MGSQTFYYGALQKIFQDFATIKYLLFCSVQHYVESFKSKNILF